MNQPIYTAIQHLDHDQFGYLVSDPVSGRCLGGVGANYYRAWVFPLYTPNGLTVIQEFPFDHPFHNGFWVAQGPIFIDGREVTFWPSPPMRKANEALFSHMGRMETLGKPQIEPIDNGVRFQLKLLWRDKNEQPVLDEVRTIDLYSVEDATICDMRSSKIASYGALDFAQTKFGSIGIRVEPRLLPISGDWRCGPPRQCRCIGRSGKRLRRLRKRIGWIGPFWRLAAFARTRPPRTLVCARLWHGALRPDAAEINPFTHKRIVECGIACGCL